MGKGRRGAGKDCSTYLFSLTVAGLFVAFASMLGMEMIPFLAMAGFAGLRRSELVREYAEDEVLRWEDINWQKQLVTVRHAVAKQTSPKMGNRRFIPMETALLLWLGPYRKEEGLLIPWLIVQLDDE